MSGNYWSFSGMLFIIIVPGLPWWRVWMREHLSSSLARLVALSTGISLFIHVVLAVVGLISVKAWSLCLFLNFFLFIIDEVRRLSGWAAFYQTLVRLSNDCYRGLKKLPVDHWKLSICVSVMIIISTSILIFSAIHLVPPLLDQDFETEATAWGLIYEGMPYCVNDRGLAMFYAHPLMFHWYVAVNALLSGNIDSFKEYYIISSRSQRELEQQASPLNPSTQRRLVKKELAGMLARFERDPDKRIVRGVSVVFSVMTLVLLYLSQVDIRRYPFVGLFPICFLLTTPEYIVRASYGGYMAISHFIMTLSILCAHGDKPDRPGEFWTGLLGGLTNHKLVFLYVGQQLARLLLVWKTGFRVFFRTRQWHVFLSFGLIGFLLGTALFWLYGLVTCPDAFLFDHVHLHFVDRLTGEQAFTYTGYLTRLGLWREFFDHQGWLFLIITVYSLVMMVVRQRVQSLNTLIPLALAVILFTQTDWRQTKHLMLLIPLVFTGFVLPNRGWARFVIISVCILGILRNGRILIQMLGDFSVVTPTPLW